MQPLTTVPRSRPQLWLWVKRKAPVVNFFARLAVVAVSYWTRQVAFVSEMPGVMPNERTNKFSRKLAQRAELASARQRRKTGRPSRSRAVELEGTCEA